MIKVIQKKCKFASAGHCGGAMNCEVREICPVDAFVIKGDSISIDPGKCIECGACMVVCQQKAIELND